MQMIRASAIKPVQAAPKAPNMNKITQKIQKVALAGAVGFTSIVLQANADATVKLGGDDGALAFVPNTVTIKSGESVTWVNNKSFPHNIVFDEDGVPEGVNVDKLSHEDYLNGPGATVTSKFDKPGTYNYNCEPHTGIMLGKIIVQ